MKHSNWMRRLIGAVALLSFTTAIVSAATLSGTVTFPVSDGGDAPRTATAKIRVMGTPLTAAVIENTNDWSKGSFSLANVPNGPITLVLEEPLASGMLGDRFTQDSKRLQLNVAGDVSGLVFAPVFHWQNLPSYPPPYHNPSYDIWQPYFVSDQIGFMSFLNRGVSPMVHELWRTQNGGTSWSKIGEWVHGTAPGIPDFVSGLDMLFVDADHGVMTARVGPPNYVPVGVLRTADGGATWENIDFPNVPPEGGDPGGNGRVNILGYAAISSTHWIACGTENIGTYMGTGVAGYVTFWETTDAGATWQIAHSRRQDGGSCSAMGAYSDGRAFVFDTPYAFGGLRILAIRDEVGAWTLQSGNNLVTNTGYGPADTPVVDGTAWLSGARWEGFSTIEQGTYRSSDGGLTWSKIGDALLQSLDFATQLKGFATAGGPAYASYDGGKTWRFQAQGGGVCCHGNYVYAFGASAAIWKDGGVGDPNGVSDVFRYSEAAEPSLEVLRGSGVTDRTADHGAALVPVLALELTSRGVDGLELLPVRIRASGTGSDRTEITSVGLWLDRNANGIVDGDDTGIVSTSFGADDGEAVLDPAGAVTLEQLNPRQLLVTYDLAVGIRDGVTFTATVDSTQLEALTIDGSARAILATAPVGTVITGGTVTSRVVPRFEDVPANHWAFSYIERLAAARITTGCGTDRYCPSAPVTRAQMAVFLERSMRGSDFRPPAAKGTVFLDVGAQDFAASYIEQLYLDGITAGCGANKYCPDGQVTRAEMAVFLLRAKHGAGYRPPPATGMFLDVPLSYWAVHWIEQLAREGISGGCGGGKYCPSAVVTRDQMAVLLVRTFGL